MNTSLPPAARRFLSDHLLGYAQRGYRVTLHPGKSISAPGMTYTGEATAEKLEIAIGGPWGGWLGILAHETCHLDQHLEDPTSFNRADAALARVSSWLDHTTDEVDPSDFQTILELESDCEVRSLKKIEQYDLPLDPLDYTRRANAYLLSYGVALRSRKWIPQPYRDDSLCERMDSSKIANPAEALAPNPLVPDSEFLRLAEPLATPPLVPPTQPDRPLGALEREV